METADFLIIGQGLAGSLLAWELIRRDLSVIVIDNGKSNASTVAAGIINPVTGIRLALTYDVETLLPAARHYYAQLADFFGQPFYHEMPMLRLFRNEEEKAYGNKRLLQLSYQDYFESKNPQPLITEVNYEDVNIAGIKTSMGWLKQKQTGYLSIAPLLERLKQLLFERRAYRQEQLNYQDIDFTGIAWQGIKAKGIIFCEGYRALENPWFNWLPMQPVKGEILTIESEFKLPKTILNYGNWLLPSGLNTARIGATFDREQIDNQPSEQGKQTLLTALKPFSMGLAQAKVLAHEAGVRPSTADKKPFIGSHPRYNNLLIFNGFGSKGSLQIPWHCQRMADYLQHQTPLPVACDIKRYQASHFPG